MQWKSVKDNYHIKYNDYFEIDKNNKIVINKKKYYLKDITFEYIDEIVDKKQEYEFMIYGTTYLDSPCLVQAKINLTIALQPKEKIKNHDIFSIHDFSHGKNPNHCIYWKQFEKKQQRIFNGEIVEDLVNLVSKKDDILYKLEFKINYYKEM